MNKNDRAVAINGTLWTSVSTVVTMLTQMLRLIILTRFLEKSDFGLVSITNTILIMCLTFSDLGFASVIMYKKEITKEEFSSLYWIQTLFFSILFILLIFLSPFIASYYSDPLLRTLIILSGLSLFGQCLGKMYDNVLLKAYLFKSLAYRNIATSFISLLLAWWMAFKGFGVYSLIVSTLVQTFLFNLWNFIKGYQIQPIGLSLKFRKALPLVKIGIYETGTHILDFFSNKIDVFIIGKLLGMEALGVYDLAKEIVVKFVYLIRTVVSKVALPILANNNNDDDAVRNRFLSMTKVVAYLCIPICITLAVFSEPVVRILYGEKYLEIVPLVSIFSIIIMIGSVSSFFDMLGVAKGRTDLNFLYTILRVVITPPVIILTGYISILAVALGQLALNLVLVGFFWYIVVMHTYPMPIKKYLSQFGKLLIVVSLCGLIISVIRYFSYSITTLNWIANSIVFFILYLFILLALSVKLLNDDVCFVKSLFMRKIKPAQNSK